MNRDTQGIPTKPAPLLGFAQTFGNQRAMSDSNKSKDGQRPANNTGPNPKRRRTIDRSDERSQRDGAEASRPAVSTGREDAGRLDYGLLNSLMLTISVYSFPQTAQSRRPQTKCLECSTQNCSPKHISCLSQDVDVSIFREF